MATRARPPDTDVARVRRYCQQRIPAHVRNQIQLETVVRGSAITILERRPLWREDFGPEWTRLKISQLRYHEGVWTLHWADRNGRWLRYPDIPPTAHLDDLLAEIDRDPAGAFWG